MDKQRNAATLLYADFPGLDEGDSVTISLIDPYGMMVVTNDLTQPIGEGRYTYNVPAFTFALSGIWKVVWTPSDGPPFEQSFTVGEFPMAGMTRWEARIQLARRMGGILLGNVTFGTINSITDHALPGGTDEFVHWYLMFENMPDRGRIFRVTQYTGTALILSHNCIEVPRPGTPYALFKMDPRELDQALDAAVATLSESTLIEESLLQMPSVSGVVTLPRGIERVHFVWNESTDTQIGFADWSVRTGRRIVVPSTALVVHVRGVRNALRPVWEDSTLETGIDVTLARATVTLHASRASGPALDMEEHLRRQVAAEDAYDRALRRNGSRIPPGSREVLY